MLKGSPLHIKNLDITLSNAVNFGGQLKHTRISFQFANITAFLGSDSSATEVVTWLISFFYECQKIENALYSQKHAFNFIYLRRLKEACQVSICFVNILGTSLTTTFSLDGKHRNWYLQLQHHRL